MAVHLRIHDTLTVFLKRIGRERQDRDGRFHLIIERTDRITQGIAIHHGHLYVRDNQVVIASRSALIEADSLLAVIRHLQQKAILAEHLLKQFAVKFVVFCHQDAFACKERHINGLLFLHLRLLLHKGSAEHLAELREEERLAAESCYAGFTCLLFDARPIVGREDNDGCVISHFFSDTSHHLDAVHIGHEPIDDERLERISRLVGVPRTEHSLLAGGGPLWPHANGREHLANRGAGIEIIIGHQRVDTFQFGDRLLTDGIAAFLQVEDHSELRAFAFLAANSDGAIHHIYDILRDSHTQSGALDAAYGSRFLAGERLKDMFLILRAHTYTRILDAELILCILGVGARRFNHSHANGAV